MIGIPFGYIVAALIILGTILSALGVLSTSQGLALLIVTMTALSLWIINHFLEGFLGSHQDSNE